MLVGSWELPPSQVVGIMSGFVEKYYGITEGFSFRNGRVERETRGQAGKRVNIINYSSNNSKEYSNEET